MTRLLAYTFAMSVFATAAGADAEDNTLRIGFNAMPENTNPLHDSSREGQILQRHIYDALIYIDPYTFELRPGLAESWTVIDDLTIEFTIRDGVMFHDGSEFTVDDAVWNINHFANWEENELALSTRFNWLEGAERVDDRTFRLVANRVNPIGLIRVGFWPMMSAAYYEAEGRDGVSLRPMGTGPYRVVEHEPGQQMVLEAFDNYYADSPKGTPSIETLIIRAIPDDETRVAELLVGNLDWDFSLSLDQVAAFEGNPDLTVEAGDTFRVGYLQIDAAGRSGNEALTDVRVRQAIAHAIDRGAIAQAFYGLDPDAYLRNFCHPTNFGCLQDVPQFEYDPERARALLAEAGYADGFEVTLTASDARPDLDAIAAYLGEVGIDVSINIAPLATVRDMQTNGELQLSFGGYGGPQLGDVEGTWPAFFTGGARDYAMDEELMAMIEESQQTVDREARMAIFEELAPYLAEQVYILPLNNWSRQYVWNSDLSFDVSPDELPRFYLMSWN